jgi:hypothetical protein
VIALVALTKLEIIGFWFSLHVGDMMMTVLVLYVIKRFIIHLFTREEKT